MPSLSDPICAKQLDSGIQRYHASLRTVDRHLPNIRPGIQNFRRKLHSIGAPAGLPCRSGDHADHYYVLHGNSRLLTAAGMFGT